MKLIWRNEHTSIIFNADNEHPDRVSHNVSNIVWFSHRQQWSFMFPQRMIVGVVKRSLVLVQTLAAQICFMLSVGFQEAY